MRIVHSFNVYIDEAGDEGFDFTKRTPEWFIISAVITRQENDLLTVSGIIKETRLQFRYGATQEIHFRKLSHERKIAYLNRMSHGHIRTVTVAIHKPSLREQELFRQQNKLYFYACRFLLERVSWFCRDNFSPLKHKGDGTMQLIFSKRKNMSYKELKEYFEHLYVAQSFLGVRIHWDTVISTQIHAFGAFQSMGLQLADAVASAMYNALNKSDYGYVEDKYVEILKPIMYRYRNTIWGYGLKVFPESSEINQNSKLFSWLRIR